MLQRLREWNRARIDARRGQRSAGTDAEYAQWVRKHDTITEAARVGLLQRARRITHGPRISILMPVFDPNPAWLAEAIDSVRAQLYVNWELCIADDASTDPRVRDILAQAATQDARIRVHWRARNGHICASSNAALALATGPYIALLDHDDVLPEHALLCVAEAILRTPDADVLYSDEDKIDARGRRHGPYFKRNWNAELLRGQNYISHLGVYRTQLVREVGGFRAGFEGSQDYDLALRCTERSTPARIVHIPHVLYHWRVHAQSTASDVAAKPYAPDAGVRALQDHLNRTHARGDAFLRDGSYHVLYHLPMPWPSIAMVLLDVGGRWTLRRALRRIAGAADLHVISTRARAHGWPHIGWHRAHGGVRPRACNALIASLRADVIVLLDSDCLPESWNALHPLIAHAVQPGVAAAGPRVVSGKYVVGTAMVGSDGGLVPWRADARAPAVTSGVPRSRRMSKPWAAGASSSSGACSKASAASRRVAMISTPPSSIRRYAWPPARAATAGCPASPARIPARNPSPTPPMPPTPATPTCAGTTTAWPTPIRPASAGQCRTPPMAAEPFSRRAPNTLRTQRR